MSSIALTVEEVAQARRGVLSMLRRPLDPQPELRWGHLGGASFCKGDHPKHHTCEEHVVEIPCPFGEANDRIVDAEHTISLVLVGWSIEKRDGVWEWVLETVVEAA